MIKYLMLLTSVVLTPVDSERPIIVSSRGSRYEVRNPAKSVVTVTLFCGIEWQRVKLILAPESTDFFSISEPDGHLATCFIENWKKAK